MLRLNNEADDDAIHLQGVFYPILSVHAHNSNTTDISDNVTDIIRNLTEITGSSGTNVSAGNVTQPPLLPWSSRCHNNTASADDLTSPAEEYWR